MSQIDKQPYPYSDILRENGCFTNRDYFVAVSEGEVAGHKAWSKIGYNPAIGTTEEDIWSYGGIYTFPASAMQMQVASSDATADADIGTILFNATCDAGGTTTTMLDAGVNFTATAEIGDYIIIEKSGTTPEWGVLTAVANGSVTFANGLSSGGSCATARTYQILDSSVAKGAMAVIISYLDSTYADKKEIVILNTSTYVNTVATNILRINAFRVIAVGTKATATNSCIGNLTLRGVVDTIVYSYMLIGQTRARNSVYTVPLGKTLFINSGNFSASTPNDTKVQTARITTKANVEPDTMFRDSGRIFYHYTDLVVTNSAVELVIPIPTKLPAKTDIKVSAIGFTGFSGPVSSVLRGWLEG